MHIQVENFVQQGKIVEIIEFDQNYLEFEGKITKLTYLTKYCEITIFYTYLPAIEENDFKPLDSFT